MPGNIHLISLEEVATWPKSNYVNPEERTWLPAFSIAWTVVVTGFVFTRLYLRARNKSGSLGLDDLFILIAYVFSVAFTASACVSVWRYKIGRHIWDIPPDDFEPALLWGWLAQILFLHTILATKVSILLFYRRIAKNAYGKNWLIAVWVLLLITIAIWIATFLSYCFMCSPLSAYWRAYLMQAVGDNNYTCINGPAFTIVVGALSIASDLWTAILPCVMFQVYDLGVTTRQKVALNVIFCIGFLVTGISIARTYYLWQLNWAMDIAWIGYDLFVSSMAECQLAIILYCAPFLRSLFRRWFPDRTQNTRGTKTGTDRKTWSSHGIEFEPVAPQNLHGDVPHENRGEKNGYLVLDSSPTIDWNPMPALNESQRLSSHTQYNQTPSLHGNSRLSRNEPQMPLPPIPSPRSWQHG